MQLLGNAASYPHLIVIVNLSSDPSLALIEAETINKKAKRASDLGAENTKLRETIEGLKMEIVAGKSNGKSWSLAFSHCNFM